MASLQDYIDETYDLLKDTNALFWSTKQVTRYVNKARRQTAILSGCIQMWIPGQSSFGGAAQPGTFIPGGATPGMPPTNTFQTISGVEKYSYTFANAYLQNLNAGVYAICDVNSVAVSWGGIRPQLDWMAWEDLQAYARSYNIGVTSYPYVWSTVGDGQRGHVWLFPVPTSALEMEWLVNCVPKAIYTNDDYDAVPEPFSDYVPFYAAHLAYLNSQRYGQANIMLDLFYSNSGIARVSANRGKTPSFYSLYNTP